MKNKKLSLIVSIFVVCVVGITAAITFALASGSTPPSNPGASNSSETVIDQFTTIDDIIMKATEVLTDENGQEVANTFTYNVVELYATEPSALKDLCDMINISDGTNTTEIEGFAEYVFNGNKSTAIGDLKMAKGHIKYTGYKASTVSTEEQLKNIAEADFIYVSNVGGADGYSTTNDLPEDVYQILAPYAVGKYNPLVIDAPSGTGSSSGGGGTGGGGTTPPAVTDNKAYLGNVVKEVYDVKGIYYYAFKWSDPATKSASDFLNRTGSAYLKINGKNQKNSGCWTEITDPSDNTKTLQVAKFLVVSKSGSYLSNVASLSGKLLADASTVDNTTYGFAATDKVYDIKDKLIYTSGYHNSYVKPELLKVEEVKLEAILNGTSTYDLNKYDMIIFEDDYAADGSDAIVTTADGTKDIYSTLAGLMYGKIHITYPDTLSAKAYSNGGTTDPINPDVPVTPPVLNATNYEELFYNVATTTHIAKYDNVMVTNRTEFDIICKSNSAVGCKPIADLINKAAFRGVGGPSASSNMFTVLEIQPCYPIDEDLAAKIGERTPRDQVYRNAFGSSNYYLKPCDVLKGYTKEMIYAKDDYSDIEAGQEYIEYYKWDLSKAKIAEAFDLSVDQVNLVQMSSEEFACNKTQLLGNYDLVYIGGNISALKDAGEYKGPYGLSNGQYSTVKNLSNYLSTMNKLPIYTTYSHTGDLIGTKLYYSQTAFKLDETPINRVTYNGVTYDSFATLNGNDITYTNYTDLKAYIDAGMPIIISDTMAGAYQSVIDFGYLQNSLDPDSNMCQLLADCYTKHAASVNNVLWSFDAVSAVAVEKVDNEAGRLGPSVADGEVTVFKDAVAGNVSQLYTASAKRPKVTITTKPATYDQYDTTTRLENSNFSFAFRVSGSSEFKVSLQVDVDGDGRFGGTTDASYQVGTSASLTKTTNDVTGAVTYSFTKDIGMTGPIYWQLTVTDLSTGATGGASVSFSDISFVTKTTPKQNIRILQVLPENCQGAQGADSLFFCPVCQQTYSILKNNPYDNSGNRFSNNSWYAGNYQECNGPVYELSDWSTGQKVVLGTYYTGKHEHEFGIPFYDSTYQVTGANKVGGDIWDKNLADEVSDSFDFDIDIMEIDELEALSKMVQQAYVMTEDEINTYAAKFDDYVTNNVIQVTTDEEILKNQGIISFTPEEYDALTTELKARYAKSQYYKDVANCFWAVYENMLKTNSNAAISNVDVGLTAKGIDVNDLASYLTGTDVSISDLTGTISYTTYDAKTLLNTELQKMITAAQNNVVIFSSLSKDMTVSELQRLIDTEKYYDYFSIGGNAARYSDVSNSCVPTYLSNTILDDYGRYQQTKDLELKLLETYKLFNRLASFDDLLAENYDTVIFGPAEVFGMDDLEDYTDFDAEDDFTLRKNDGFKGQALRDLVSYVSQGKQVILFHDTLQASGKSGTVNICKRLKEYFGMDRFHMEIDESKMSTASGSETYYTPYKVKAGYSTNKYKLTNLYYDNSPTKYSAWLPLMRSYFGNAESRYYTTNQLTDVIAVGQSGSDYNVLASPYKYAEFNFSKMTAYATDSAAEVSFGTDRATQNNRGIITTYPFTLSDKLNISGTHSQSFALDIESDKMTVWYSLAGGSNYKPTSNGVNEKLSSVYAATPNDGMDNYFIYSYGNIFYCGAGHSNVTGLGKDNNDERRLYINIICNSVRDTSISIEEEHEAPTVEIHDWDADTNTTVIAEADGTYTINTTDFAVPEFSLRATTNNGSTISNIDMHFDLSITDEFVEKYLAGTLTADEMASLIYSSSNESQLKINKLDSIENFTSGNRYNAGSGGNKDSFVIDRQPLYSEYVYIVVRVTDSTQGANNTTIKFIKVKNVPFLFELT